MEAGTEGDDASTCWKLIPGAAGDDLLLVFAHRDAERFAFTRATRDLPCHRLFARDPTGRGWYNRGIPGLGDTVQEVAASLRSVVAEHRCRRVFVLGSSMGGYAALLFGALLGADGVLAFNPQSLLDPVFPLSPPGEVEISVRDVRPAMQEGHRTRFDVVVSEDDAVDLFHLARLAALPQLHPWTVRGASHLVTEELDRRGELRPLLMQWVTGVPKEVLSPLPLLQSVAARDALTCGVHAFMADRFAEAFDDLHLAALLYPNHPGLWHFLGIAALRTGRVDRAVEAFRNALAHRPGWTHTEELLREALALRHGPPRP